MFEEHASPASATIAASPERDHSVAYPLADTTTAQVSRLMNELTVANCELIGLVANQPNVGFEIIGDDGVVQHSTQSARRILFGDEAYDPVGSPLSKIEGDEVGQEWQDAIGQVCQSGAPLRFRQVRIGRLLTAIMWPLRKEPSVAPDSVMVMVTFAVDTSEPGMLEYLEVSRQRGAETEGEQPTNVVTSSFATWGRIDVLTPRERDVLVLIGRGNSQKEIAEALQVSAKTVETHRMRLGKKLHVKSGAELVGIACHSGIGLEHTSLKRQRGFDWTEPSFSSDPISEREPTV